MYLQNKYSFWYYSIINRAKSRQLPKTVYVEKHHIIPRSLGGDNSENNLAILTAKEHFICHLLLPKMTIGRNHFKMLCAAWRICTVGDKKNKGFHKINSITYERIKTQRSNYLKSLAGPNHFNRGRKTGRTSESFTEEWKKRISDSRKGKSSWNKGIPRTEAEKEKIRNTRRLRKSDPNWNKRPPCSIEKAQKISTANSGKKWIHNPNQIGLRKCLDPEDCILYITQGWIYGFGPGRKFNSRRNKLKS